MKAARGKPRLAALGYPSQWLEPLAYELAQQAQLAAVDPFGIQPTPDAPLVVVEGPPLAIAQRERFEQPADSRILVTELPNGWTFEVPPAGLRKGSAGLFAFSCIWLGIIMLITGIAVTAIFQPQPQAANDGRGFMLLFLIPFWLVGIALLLLAIHLGRRQANLVVADSRVLISQTGLLRTTCRSWEPGELSSVQIGSSGMETNDKPVLELQLFGRDGKKFGLLGGRDESELEWLATLLRQALGLSLPSTGDVGTMDVEQQPATSHARCEEWDGALTIQVPRVPLRSGPLFFWVFGLAWNALNALVFAVFVHGGQAGLIGLTFPLGMFLLFAAIGIGVWGMALHMTIARAEFAVAGGNLLVIRFGLLGKRRQQWDGAELSAIRVGDSGTHVNNKPLLQLQMVPLVGKPVTMLLGRDEMELAWIATRLRRALDLPARTPAENSIAQTETATRLGPICRMPRRDITCHRLRLVSRPPATAVSGAPLPAITESSLCNPGATCPRSFR